LGYGPIDRLLKDDDITEVMVNGPDLVYAERSGKVEKTGATFVDETHLRRIIDKIVGQVGRRIDEAQPLCDARLPDGSRVNAVIHPLAIGGPFLTIRKFSKDPYQIDDLIRFGTLNAASARFLQAMLVGKLNIIISGGTGTGKTDAVRVYFDDRVDMYPIAVTRDYTTLIDPEGDYEAVLDRSRASAVLWDRDSDFGRWLERSDRWRAVHRDADWLVVVSGDR